MYNLLDLGTDSRPTEEDQCNGNVMLWYQLVSARFINASMYRDTCHTIRIAIQFASIAILNFVVVVVVV